MKRFTPLVIKVSQSKEQIGAVTHLLNAEGLCHCGRFLKSTDAKGFIAQVNSREFLDPNGRNTIVIKSLCFGCFQRVNDLLRALHNRLLVQEPDRKREIGK